MSEAELDARIAAFIERKDAQYPRLGLIKRDESRTIKFPLPRKIHLPHPA